MEGNEAADELVGQGREPHLNNLLPLSKHLWRTKWDTLGREPMMEIDDLRVSSDVDSGWGIQQHSKS